MIIETPFFTDAEHRILLAAISREEKICRQVDLQSPGEVCLTKLVKNIERKVRMLQGNDLMF